MNHLLKRKDEWIKRGKICSVAEKKEKAELKKSKPVISIPR